MKYFLIALMFLFFVGVAIGAIDETTTTYDIQIMYYDLIDYIFDTFKFVGELGTSAISFFQNTVHGVKTVIETAGNWVENAWNWVVNIFN